MSLETSLRMLGYPADEIKRLASPTAVERVAAIIAGFDALSNKRKTAVNPRDLIERIREAIAGTESP